MKKFKNKYRIPSARLQHWDYTWHGAYFITVCTHQCRHLFGNIIAGNDGVQPNEPNRFNGTYVERNKKT